jgi:hypothetical protein
MSQTGSRHEANTGFIKNTGQCAGIFIGEVYSAERGVFAGNLQVQGCR